ncbi:hypothetical protein PoB_005752400 [Plakobranchus ocellatus]|uniref:RNase H type-1 domain-containing protein n=1 Tax=Plakobranchus ocellatus TaxID=259542 RepID=A0AAV4CJI6_9GAST|nr:hypothetical protein PoB_005752400 [Plakobranchus ocellatus]
MRWRGGVFSGPPAENGGMRTMVHWLLPHVGFIDNDIADGLANQGRTQPQPRKPSTLSNVRSILRRDTAELWSAALLSNDEIYLPNNRHKSHVSKT